MKRLTDWNYKNTTLALDSCKPYLKLGQLEDIEEELGIDLSILVKAIFNGIWIRESCSYGTCDLEGKPIFINPHYLHLGIYDYYECRIKEYEYSEYESALCFYDMEYESVNNVAKVKDYGKTWALTKEELEDDR